jgi:hypothetical protein
MFENRSSVMYARRETVERWKIFNYSQRFNVMHHFFVDVIILGEEYISSVESGHIFDNSEDNPGREGRHDSISCSL